MSSMTKIVKQAARARQQLEQVQSQLATRTVEATSGGGAVKVVAKCDGTVASIKIDPQAANPSDVTMLEDLVLSAVDRTAGSARGCNREHIGASRASRDRD